MGAEFKVNTLEEMCDLMCGKEVKDMWYKAEYEDDRFEMILANSDEEALEKAYDNEEEFGTLFNVFALDDDDNEIRTVF